MPKRRRKSIATVQGVTAGTRVPTTNCAAWSNGWLRDKDYMVSGNAWDSKGVSEVYSGYNGLTRPAVFDENAVITYNNAASDNVYKNFDSKTQLVPGQPYVVNMYYKGSPYLEEAYKNGTRDRTGTHTGNLVDDGNGNWYVIHNIHGQLHVDPFTKIQGGNKSYGVTGIYKPRRNNLWNRAITRLGFDYGGSIGYYPRYNLNYIIER